MDELSSFLDRLNKAKQSEIGFLDINLGKDFIFEFLETYSKLSKEHFLFEELLENNPLELPEKNIDSIKKWLVHISKFTRTESLEIFKEVLENPEFTEIHAWAQMCDMILKANFRSEILNEDQMFMLTGMGGKDNKIRMFVGFVTDNKVDFTEVQANVLKKELSFTLNKHKGELEKIEFDAEVAKAIFLLPFDARIGDIISQAVEKANELGHYIKDNFLFTNNGELSRHEILDFFEKKEKPQTTQPKEDTNTPPEKD